MYRKTYLPFLLSSKESSLIFEFHSFACFVNLIGVEPGKQIAVGTEQFEDLGCGYLLLDL